MSSPTSTSLPPARPSPFSRLPPELVQLVIESTVPPQFRSDTYRERQSTLCSLCLVSRLFHEIAKPLLFSSIQFWRKGYELWMVERRAPRGASCSLVREIFIRYGTNIRNWTILSLFTDCPNLSRLVIDGRGTFRINASDLPRFPNLSTLQLANLEVMVKRLHPLRSIKTLSLLNVKWTRPCPEILNSSNLPSLQCLLWGDIERSGNRSDACTTLSLLSSQLDLLSLEVSFIKCLPLDLLNTLGGKTLFDAFGLHSHSLPSVPFLRYLNIDGNSLLDLVESSPSEGLPSIIYLKPHLLDDGETRSVQELCRKRNIEVVFEEQPSERAFDLGISNDFWRRMKERKARAGEES